MKVTQKGISKDHVQLQVVASAVEVDQAFNIAQQMFAQQMGLHPVSGKTIAQVAESQLKIRDLDSVVEPQAVEYLAPFAVTKKDL